MRGLVAGLLISIPLLIVVVLFAGGGHGTYLPAKVLFPYSMLLAMTAARTITNPLITLAIAQFPVYGLIIDRAIRNGTVMKTTIGVAVLHLGALVGCLLLRNNSF